jgi:hypothetical protein
MKDSRSTSQPLLIGLAVLLLAGCSGSPSSLAPAGSAQSAHRVVSYHGLLLPTAVVPKSFGRQAQPKTASGLLLDARTRRLLYVSSFDESHPSGLIVAYSMPILKYVYDITRGVSVPVGECSRTGTKTFWAADEGADALYEFQYRGKRPIKTLSTGGVEPSGCSIDPSSGNVAAAIISNGGGVMVWPKGSGTPIAYTTPLITAYFVGYDANGDLFVDGFKSTDVFGLAELPKGSSTFESVTLNQEIEFPGNVQWDGSYLAIGDQMDSVVYQFACTGASCSEHGSTPLAGAIDCVQFWIDKGTVACPDAGSGDIGLWHYPAGGSSYATASQIPEPLGSVIVRR